MSELKAKVRSEHIALIEESSKKIDGWIEQIESKKRVRVSRKDIVNWFIARSPELLSNSDHLAISEAFYDEEALLRQLLRQVKQAKKAGHSPVLDVIVRAKKGESKKLSLESVEPTQITSSDLNSE